MPSKRQRAIVVETLAYYLSGRALGYFQRMVDAQHEGRELGPLSTKERAALWDKFAERAAHIAAAVREGKNEGDVAELEP